MQQVEVNELKSQTNEILRNVSEAKTEYIVTYHGQPMARLLPLEYSKSELSKDNTLERSQALAQEALAIEHSLEKEVNLPEKKRQVLEALRDWLVDYQPEDDAIMDEFDKLLANSRFSLHADEITAIEK